MSNNANEGSSKMTFKEIMSKTGPSIIMAAAAVGTGTITTSAMLGANYAYALVWMVILAMTMRGLYMRSAYTSQIVLGMPVLDSIRKFYGKGWSIFGGFICAFGCIAYECGNFSGTGMALSLLFPIDWKIGGVIMSVACILLIFGRGVYHKIEKVMKLCVFLMVAGFLVTLILVGGPSPKGIVTGLVPSLPDSAALFTTLAFIGSCAAISGVVYGTHLSKEKKWSVDDIKNKAVKWDTIIGVGSIGVIVLLVLFTAAKVLNPQGIQITHINDLIEIIVPLAGKGAQYVMGVCLLAAAVSSYIVSAQMGASLLLAGFGKDADMDDRNVQILSVIILVLGGIVAFIFGSAPIQVILISNICAILNAPILAVFIILLVNRKEMGEFKSSKKNNAALLVCLVLLLAVTAYNIAKFVGLV